MYTCVHFNIFQFFDAWHQIIECVSIWILMLSPTSGHRNWSISQRNLFCISIMPTVWYTGAAELAYSRINTIVFSNSHTVNHSRVWTAISKKKPNHSKGIPVYQEYEPHSHRSVALGPNAKMYFSLEGWVSGWRLWDLLLGPHLQPWKTESIQMYKAPSRRSGTFSSTQIICVSDMWIIRKTLLHID